MKTIKGTYKNGQVILSEPVDWPEGKEVIVEPAPEAENLGLREEDWQDTPAAIAEWTAWYDSLEPLVFTPEEEAGLKAWRRTVNDYTRANAHKEIEGLFE